MKMPSFSQNRSRTTTDILLGMVMVLAGAAMITYSAVALQWSVQIVAWATIVIGVGVGVHSYLTRETSHHWWRMLAGGILLIILGIILLTNPASTAILMTVAAAVYFILSGILRVVASYAREENRVVLSAGGIASIVLGSVALMQVQHASKHWLAFLVGIELVIEGVTLALAGRNRKAKKVEGESIAKALPPSTPTAARVATPAPSPISEPAPQPSPPPRASNPSATTPSSTESDRF